MDRYFENVCDEPVHMLRCSATITSLTSQLVSGRRRSSATRNRLEVAGVELQSRMTQDRRYPHRCRR
jgi:hypothetical protein